MAPHVSSFCGCIQASVLLQRYDLVSPVAVWQTSLGRVQDISHALLSPLSKSDTIPCILLSLKPAIVDDGSQYTAFAYPL